MKLTQQTAEQELHEQKEFWRFKNRNAVREIAQQFGVSITFVRRVFKGELKSGELRVEQELARRGCPGF